ncbi:MAG: PhoH family protein [Sphingomonadaceae bacterium]|nr:PhoH family protein [Sphingomonadaceae bacterium]
MRSRPTEYTPEAVDNRRLANLCGALDQNLRQIEEAFDVRIARRGASFSIEGTSAASRRAVAALKHFYARTEHPLSLDDVQLGLVELKAPARAAPETSSEEAPVLHTRRADLQGRTPHQREYLRNILSHDITFGIGPAGTGKTYLAVACAVDALERDVIQRIVLTRPAVEAGERLGFLPGDLAQKVDPYLRPLYDALYDLLGFDRTARMFEKQAIEIAPLAYMRGRTLNNSFIILDEAQNTTPEQMKMFLTRFGQGSRMVICGDPKQVDLPNPGRSGLHDATQRLEGIEGIAVVRFGAGDVVRHPIVGRIVEAYEGPDA